MPAPIGWTKTLTFNGTIIQTGTDSHRLAQNRARAQAEHAAG